MVTYSRLFEIAACVAVATITTDAAGGMIDVLPAPRVYGKTGCYWHYDGEGRPNNGVLNCSSLSLDTYPEKSLFGMRRAGTIWLDHNHFTVVEKSTFSRSIGCQFLYLDHNKLTLIYDGAFDNMNILKVLTLSANKFGSFPKGLGSISSLQMLDLSDNFMSVLSRATGNAYGSSVRWLNLNRNQIEYIKCGFFINGKLNYLSMEGNPSPCEITKSGAVDCECATAYLQGPGYCDGNCKAGSNPPQNLLSMTVLPVNSSWEKITDLLNDYAGIPFLYSNISKAMNKKDGSEIVIQVKKTTGDGINEDGSGPSAVITVVVCIAVVALSVIGTVFAVKKIRSARNQHPSSLTATSVSSEGDGTLPRGQRLSTNADTIKSDVTWNAQGSTMKSVHREPLKV